MLVLWELRRPLCKQLCTSKYLVIFVLLRFNCAIVIRKIYYRFKQDIYSLYVYRRKKCDQRSNGFSAVLYDILGYHCNEYEGYFNLVCDAVWYDRNLPLFRHYNLLQCWRWGRRFLRNFGTFVQTTRVTRRSWLRHCATSRKVVGSIPHDITGIFHWHNPSGLTQPLTEISNRNISLGVKTAGA